MYSISCTTRTPRTGEVDGRDYYFLSPEEFDQRRKSGGFLEHATVHAHSYGTPRDKVLEAIEVGRDLLLDIDVQGADQIRQCEDPRIRQALADIFLMPASAEELERRLRGRGTDDEATVRLRLENARREMACHTRYRYTLISGTREEDLQAFLNIIQAERCLTHRIRLDE